MKNIEKERHRCEVRWLIQIAREHGWTPVMKFFDMPAIQSRKIALQIDVKDQVKKGNTGQKGEWYE